ncbi:hypothetical protein Tco_0619800 [Tanacetum coccineum]
MRASMGEFTQGIKDILFTQGRHKASRRDPKKKVNSSLIPYGWYFQDDFILGNLKFVPKGETVKVFGMAIPDPLITEAIQQSSYYPKYLEMVAKCKEKPTRKCRRTATKRAPPKKPQQLLPVNHPSLVLLPTRILPKR